MRRVDQLRVASRVADAVGTDDCVLVGGMAVGAHGYVRATRDVDFAVRPSLPEVRRRLGRADIDAVLHRDASPGGSPCLKTVVDGVPVDVIPPLVPIDWDRALKVPLGKRRRLPVVDLESLLRLKLRAGGPRDLLDVAALLSRHPDHLDRAKVAAAAYGVVEDLERWLADPRLTDDR
jgi:hypothetical protein